MEGVLVPNIWMEHQFYVRNCNFIVVDKIEGYSLKIIGLDGKRLFDGYLLALPARPSDREREPFLHNLIACKLLDIPAFGEVGSILGKVTVPDKDAPPPRA